MKLFSFKNYIKSVDKSLVARIVAMDIVIIF